jgi:predicted amidophosphoribosyltransferase
MLQRLWPRAMDWLMVPGCPACDAPGHPGLCPRCTESLYEVGPACPRCAEPMAGPVALLCRRCRVRPPPFARALSPYRYGGELAVALRRLKYVGTRGHARGHAGKSMTIPIGKRCLRRVRATAPQSGLSLPSRAANVSASFAVPPRY